VKEVALKLRNLKYVSVLKTTIVSIEVVDPRRAFPGYPLDLRLKVEAGDQ